MISKATMISEIEDYLYSLKETIGINIASEKEQLDDDVNFTLLNIENNMAKEVTVKLIIDNQGHSERVIDLSFKKPTKAKLIFYYLTETKELFTMDARLTQDWVSSLDLPYVWLSDFNKEPELRERIKIKKIQLI
jgi:hypothetical protein